MRIEENAVLQCSVRKWPEFFGCLAVVLIFFGGGQCSEKSNDVSKTDSLPNVNNQMHDSLEKETESKKTRETRRGKNRLGRGKGKESDIVTIEDRLLVLSVVEGKEYLKRRDEFLSDTLFPLFLDNYKNGTYKNSNWRIRMIAAILAGWSENSALYEKYLTAVNSIDIPFAQKKAGGPPSVWSQYANIAKEEYGHALLPLCWEAVFKLSDVYHKVIFPLFIVALIYLPDEQSLDLMLYYIKNKDEMIEKRYMAGFIVNLKTVIPEKDLKARLQSAFDEQKETAEAIEYAIDCLEDD